MLYIWPVEISRGDSREEKQFMIKRWALITVVFATILYFTSGFNTFIPIRNYSKSELIKSQSTYLFPSLNPHEYQILSTPYTAKFFIGFKEALAFKESQGKYRKINSLGYMGKYQFGAETLREIGIYNHQHFLQNPILQEQAFLVLLAKNKWDLQDEIDTFSGKIIAGVSITESGILAAAHLGGVRSVKRFLYSQGKRKCRDQYGSSVRTYMRDFGGFETTAIVAQNNPRVN
ncbi:MAG: peptidoglycan-binding protein LysM [Flavobacterium psychrophilum]